MKLLQRNLLCSAPGAVSDLVGVPTVTSIMLTWSPPEEPNGVILGYEVTYNIDDNATSTNLTSFTISSLTPETRVSNISVTAYTVAGHGELATLDNITTLPEKCKLH